MSLFGRNFLKSVQSSLRNRGFRFCHGGLKKDSGGVKPDTGGGSGVSTSAAILSGLQSARNLLAKGFTGRNLIITNVSTSGILLAFGDFLEQNLEKKFQKKHQYEYQRTGRMFVVGLSVGYPHHFWYLLLDQLMPKKCLRTVCLKILADQLIAAPFFAVTFFYGMGLLQGKGLKECWIEFAQKFAYIYAFDWVIWPPTQYINFAFIPSQYRVLYVNSITVVWDIFLSYMKHYDEHETLQEQKLRKI